MLKSTVKRIIIGMILGTSATAFAILAPMPEEALEAAADIVVDAKVINVECLSAPVNSGANIKTHYRATFSLIKTYQGTAPATFYGKFTETAWLDAPPIGGWDPWYAKGEKGKYYLTATSETDTYAQFSWNGFEGASDSAPESLPDCFNFETTTDTETSTDIDTVMDTDTDTLTTTSTFTDPVMDSDTDTAIITDSSPETFEIHRIPKVCCPSY